MKTVFGFLAVVFSVLIFAPRKDNNLDKELQLPKFDKVEHHYTPSIEAIESRRKLDECERKIRANISYLKANENTKTTKISR